ncbi:MAG: hypothetical protein KKC76_19675 [Proteobacteria bacterium]|nr:hypothetical protein [Pseudomonadota bacterium]MBU4296939.1 hypothetical protein [Pseudomonadota bacterium]MCG2746101.1 hypothetical protein [Desulfobulbaceae bacterium]
MIDVQRQEAGQEQNRWFVRRRDFFVTSMLKSFYRTAGGFLQIYQGYLKTGTAPYNEIDKLVGTENRKGCLWQLKDDCHQLWRNGDSSFELNGSLLDWIIGSLFHEAMKLKENIYLFEYYAPLAHDMKGEWRQEIQQFCGVECRRFMERIAHEVDRQMESLGFMFGRAIYLLRTMLPSQKHNPLLVRYFVEHRDVASELWSESLDEIFKDMFNGVPESGYCFAAQSYFDGNWYEKSLAAYQEALRVNEHCDEAILRTGQLEAILTKANENYRGNSRRTQLL